MNENKDIYNSSLINEDLAPIPQAKRKWGTWNYAALWISMSLCIPTYTMASSMINQGMSWWQAVLTIFIGNAIVLVPMLLNGHAGAKFDIPFPVLLRASFGTRGSNIPAMLRAVVACGWFGIQTWLGGAAIDVLLGLMFPSWKSIHGSFMGVASHTWIAFFAFWLIQIYFIVPGLEG